MTKSKYEFKGGDNFTGIYRDYHEIMMRNELRGGKGAYRLSWAGTGKSGPSFGGNQMDLAKSQYGRRIFLHILRNAVNELGKPFLNMDEIKRVEEILDKPEQMAGKKLESIFQDIKKIQLALCSEYGKREIDEAYVEEITWRGQRVEKFISFIKSGPGRKFAESREGRCYLFDYHNQYDLSTGGPLHKYLNGEEVKFISGGMLPEFDESQFTNEHFKTYLTYLKYYNVDPGDVTRRIKNIDDYLKLALSLEEAAKQKPEENKTMSASECAKLYEAYMEYITYTTTNSMAAFDSLTREFSRKYPNGSICEQCKAHGFDFDELFSKEAADKL